MNLIIINKSDVTDQGSVVLSQRQYQHLTKILKAKVGDTYRVGLLDGKLGTGEVVSINKDSQEIIISGTFNQNPPKSLDVHLIVALPRPLMFKRILFCATSMGVKKITFINAQRCEKTFWDSHALQSDNIYEQLILGLEQAVDTILPEVNFCRSFKTFVAQDLATIVKNNTVFVGRMDADLQFSATMQKSCALIVGPEGGFTDCEYEQLKQMGCLSVGLGKRILRVEHAVSAFLARCL